MRSLLILVCIGNLFITGCKTAKKQVSCGSSCGRCATAHIGLASIRSRPAKPRIAARPKQKTVIETSHSDEEGNPFEAVVPAKAVSKPKPKVALAPQKAHAENYRWLIGELQRVHTPKHEWKLRYADLDELDRWGGSMILAPDARLDEWSDGDLVYVKGEILTKRPSVYLSGPLYRIHSIQAATEVTQIVPRHQK